MVPKAYQECSLSVEIGVNLEDSPKTKKGKGCEIGERKTTESPKH